MTVTLLLPALYCRHCRSQVALTTAAGRPTSPTFRLAGTRELVCLWCAKTAHPADQLAALDEWHASWLPGCQTMSDSETHALLVSLGAEEAAA